MNAHTTPSAATLDPTGATPVMAQFFEMKARQPDALIFFRMGDFYELFFDDAEKAAAALGISQTFRGTHNGQPIPMAGVPQHAAEAYLSKLIRLGFKKVEGGPRDFCLDTPLGQLWASPYDDWIACRFDNLELAKQHLPHGYDDRLNKFSGKWNWHGDGLDADGYATEMLNKFEAAVNQILAMKTAHQLPGDAEPGA